MRPLAQDSPLRILLFDNTSTFGGAIVSLAQMVRGLMLRGLDVVVVSGQSPEVMGRLFPDAAWYSWHVDQPWIRLRGPIETYGDSVLPYLRRMQRHPRTLYWLIKRDVLGALRLAHVGRRHRVDLVHCNNETDSQLNGLWAARLLGVPCIAHHRSLRLDVGRSARYNASLPDGHIAVSEAVRNSVLALVPADRSVWLVHNAVDLREFAPRPPRAGLRAELGIPDGVPVVSHFGRLIAWKGQMEFLKALATIGDAHDFHALVVGDRSDGPPEYERLIREEARSSGLANRVSFTGQRVDIPDLMSLSDVVVHSSIDPEPFGRVLIEAMASGKPLVAANSGGPLDVVRHGIDGFLVDPSDPWMLGSAISTLLADEEMRHRMGAAGLLQARERFSQEICAAAVARIYEQVLSQARMGSAPGKRPAHA